MVEYLAEQKQRFGKTSRFYPLKYVLVPEENYYQTVLMNSEFGNRIDVNPPEMVEQNCKTYAWFSPKGKEFTGHPYVFTLNDVNVLKNCQITDSLRGSLMKKLILMCLIG